MDPKQFFLRRAPRARPLENNPFLVLGCTDEAAIRHLLMSDGLQHAAAMTVEIGALAAYERPLPTMAEYNQLLTIEVPA